MIISRNALYNAVKMACGLAVLSFPHVSYAQQMDEIEEVTVTGSHIQGLDLEGATNAVQIDSKAIMESGSGSLVDLLSDLSVTGGGNGTFSTAGSGPGSGQSPVGSSAVSLRGLGTSSTLTLVNGRRVSVSSFAAGGTESFVDINSIPMAAVERIEILPSGASATYGADAVAGVINIILKKDYEGSELSINTGQSSASSDDSKYNLNYVWGQASQNSRSLVVVDYFKREPLLESERSSTALSGDPSADGIYSSFNNSGVSVDDRIEAADCQADTSGNFTYKDVNTGEFGEACEYNVNADTATKGAFESYGVTATFEYDFGNNTWFNEFMYQTTESQGNRAGATFGSSGLAMSANHPGWADADAQDILSNLGSDDYYTVFGRVPEARATQVETKSLRFVSGIKGELDSWDWESAVSFGRSESEQTGVSGLINREALQAGLLGKLCSDGTIVEGDFSYTGDKALKESVSYTPGGVTCEALGKTTAWYSPFDGKANQDPAIDALLAVDGKRAGASNLYSVDYKASTLDLFTLPMGSVAAAFGAEWRREEVEDLPSDALLATADNTDPVLSFSSSGAKYSRDQYAGYGELSVPLATGLEAQLAGRYDNFDDFGDSFNGKIGLRYELIEEVIFRGNWSQSFRAPSLAQSGLSTLLASYNLDNTCTATDDPFTQAFTSAGLCNTTQREVNSEVVGNDQLEAETANTYGFGVLLRPNDDIELNIDWWLIDYENVIEDADDAWLAQTLAGNTDGIVVTTASDLPSGTPGLALTCDPGNYTASAADNCGNNSAEMIAFHSQQINVGSQSVQGVDLVYSQYIYDGNYGVVKFLMDASYLIEFEEQLIKNGPTENKEGEYSYPQLVGSAKLRWSYRDISTSISANYTGEYKDDLDTDAADNAIAAGDLIAGEERTVPSWTTYSLSASYDFASDSFVQLNVRNLLDEKPNLVYGSGANVDYSNSDTLGRFISMRYIHVF
mgnify:FL=1